MDPEGTEEDEAMMSLQQEEEEEEDVPRSMMSHDLECPCRHWDDCFIKSSKTTSTPPSTSQEPMEREVKRLESVILTSYWSLEVPPLLSPHADCDCLNITFEETRIQSRLFDPLEHFLAAGILTQSSSVEQECPQSPSNLDNVKRFLEGQSSLLEPSSAGSGGQGSQLCGRMFKPGEATYCCRDCSTDPTCVLCVDCFKASAHRGHKYRMSMSGGGGYCDCGDAEAWKGDPGCDLHRREASSMEESSGTTSNSDESAICHQGLVADIESRVECVTRALIRYCHLVLTWESGMNLPPSLQVQDMDTSMDVSSCPSSSLAPVVEEQEASCSSSSRENKVTGRQNPTVMRMNKSARQYKSTEQQKMEEEREGGKAERKRGKEVRKPEPDPSVYATMLFNDEIHTYEQVIATLGRAIECTQKEAIDFATTIDREGRSIVKCSASFKICSDVKAMIEKITGRNQGKPLRTEVMLTSVIAHQSFAGRILSWIQDRLLPCCPSIFRRVFGRIMNEPFDTMVSGGQESSPRKKITPGPSLLEQVMRSDVRLWKTARNQWHQLFVTGLLMDPVSKRMFARTFTRIYPTLCRDFVSDDHDVHVSIMSLTVQMYTVPSLGLDLLTGSPSCPGALYILLKTFLDECGKFLNPTTGKLQFERVVTTIVAFRRAQYILVDLKYLLANCKPRGMEGSNFPPLPGTTGSGLQVSSTTGSGLQVSSPSAVEEDKLAWNQELRSSFVHGFETLVQLLDWMQGMDSVVRQVGTHVEFESEWENGINLQLKLTPLLSLLIEWASSDQSVLFKSLRSCLKKLAETWSNGDHQSAANPITGSSTQRRLLDTTVEDVIEYDVSSNPVSVHAPLSRVTVALLVQLSAKYGLDLTGFVARSKPSLVQLMEPSLRTLVLAAQFRAGMWRRNGYSLVNQVYFYHNARLREEMFDRDILALQYVASILPPNEFLIHVISKFGLFLVIANPVDNQRVQSMSDDYTRQTVTIMEEFLSLLLTLVSERWTPGLGSSVTVEDRIKKEIIQCLAIEPMTHSELLKVIPKEASHWPNIESVIESVAVFKRPANVSMDQVGKYEVREELIDGWFNPFFYHYTREQSSKAEAVQLKRKKVMKAGTDDSAKDSVYVCCPPPLPPIFSTPFSPILDLVTCDVTLHLFHSVLKRATNGSPPSSALFSEVQFEKILHLISLGLREEERFIRSTISKEGSKDQVSKDERMEEEESRSGFFDFSRKCVSKGILDLLKQISRDSKTEGSNGIKLVTSDHVLELLRWTLDKFAQVLSLRGGSQETSASSPGPSCSCSSVKSMSAAEAASKRRERIMAQIRKQQKSFMKQHPSFFKEESKDVSEVSEVKEMSDESELEPVALGSNQRGRKTVIEKEVHTCIMCRDEQEVTSLSDHRSLVLCALVQRSTVLSKNRSTGVSPSTSAVPMAASPLDPSVHPSSTTTEPGHAQSASVEALFMPSDLNHGAHVSTCGHVMHADCWQRFFESVLAKERRRPLRYGRHVSFDVDKAEFLCPLCECLSNTVIPILPPCNHHGFSSKKGDLRQKEMSMSDWIKCLFASVDQSQPLWIRDPSMNSTF